MKIGAFIVLFILLTGIFCPSQITVTRTDGSPSLVSLNVCDTGGPALSVDSKIPALNVSITSNPVLLQSELTFKEYGQSYKFLSITDLLKPPAYKSSIV